MYISWEVFVNFILRLRYIDNTCNAIQLYFEKQIVLTNCGGIICTITLFCFNCLLSACVSKGTIINTEPTKNITNVTNNYLGGLTNIYLLYPFSIDVLIPLHSAGVCHGLLDLIMVIARYKNPFKPYITVYLRSRVTYRIQYNTVVKRSQIK